MRESRGCHFQIVPFTGRKGISFLRSSENASVLVVNTLDNGYASFKDNGQVSGQRFLPYALECDLGDVVAGKRETDAATDVHKLHFQGSGLRGCNIGILGKRPLPACLVGA